MKISTRGRYALRMLLDIAQNQTHGAVALKDVAERQNISKKYLEQIALQLSQAGVIRGSRGHQGGYRLVKEPQDYTVCSVLELVEGSLHPVACLDEAPNRCERCNGCETLYIWEGLDRVIRDYLSSMTLADVIHKLEQGRSGS